MKRDPALAMTLALVLAHSANGEAVNVGVTSFPLGEDAFPDTSECLDAGGGGSEDYFVHDFQNPLIPPVSPAFCLRGHRLDLVALDLDSSGEMFVGFPVPIVNLEGDDIFIAQALFIGGSRGCPRH